MLLLCASLRFGLSALVFLRSPLLLLLRTTLLLLGTTLRFLLSSTLGFDLRALLLSSAALLLALRSLACLLRPSLRILLRATLLLALLGFCDGPALRLLRRTLALGFHPALLLALRRQLGFLLGTTLRGFACCTLRIGSSALLRFLLRTLLGLCHGASLRFGASLCVEVCALPRFLLRTTLSLHRLTAALVIEPGLGLLRRSLARRNLGSSPLSFRAPHGFGVGPALRFGLRLLLRALLCEQRLLLSSRRLDPTCFVESSRFFDPSSLLDLHGVSLLGLPPSCFRLRLASCFGIRSLLRFSLLTHPTFGVVIDLNGDSVVFGSVDGDGHTPLALANPVAVGPNPHARSAHHDAAIVAPASVEPVLHLCACRAVTQDVGREEVSRRDEAPVMQRHRRSRRRGGGPAEVAVVGLSPIDPTRAPLVAGHPDPTTLVDPVAVLAGGRAHGVVRAPERTVVALLPVAVLVGHVVAVVGVEHRPVLRRLVPLAVPGEALLKHLQRDSYVGVDPNAAARRRDVVNAGAEHEHCDDGESAHQTLVRAHRPGVQNLLKNGGFHAGETLERGSPRTDWNRPAQSSAISVRVRGKPAWNASGFEARGALRPHLVSRDRLQPVVLSIAIFADRRGRGRF